MGGGKRIFGENNARLPTVTNREALAYSNIFPSSRPK